MRGPRKRCGIAPDGSMPDAEIPGPSFEAVPVKELRAVREAMMHHGFIQLAAMCEQALRGLEEIAGALRTAFALGERRD